MKATTFNYLAQSLTGKNVKILLLENQSAKKWYDKTYIPFDEISENVVYGIFYDNCHEFDLKVSNVDNIFKSFITKWVNVMIKTSLEELTKDQAFELLGNFANNIRVTKELFYTTKYGIGIFCLLFSEDKMKSILTPLIDYLKSNRIEYINDYSDARWVYRFIINQTIEKHNNLLLEFKI